MGSSHSYVTDPNAFATKAKENDDKTQSNEMSMHPLWDEYIWPTQDAEGNDLPQVNDQSSFYVNSYSGELSLEFPAQEQNCLGGILADGT